MASFGNIEDLLKQAPPGTRLARGLAFLNNFKAGRLPQVEAIVRRQERGDSLRIEIDGDRLYAIVQCYEPRARTQGSFEAHREYTDLQYLCEGQEFIEVCDLRVQAQLPPYDADGNVLFPLGSQTQSRIHLRAGGVAVLFPDDAHAPCLRVGETDAVVRKLVVKVHHAAAVDAA